MQRNRRRLAILFAVLLALGLCLMLSAQFHESLHEDDACPLCVLARTWRAEKHGFVVETILVAIAIVFCRRRRIQSFFFRRQDTLAAQRVLLLS